MIKAIETVYNGYRFRSRLEARWAVFFDALKIEYQYEPEGFDLDGRWYLPDFYLPEINGGLWVEIKPVKTQKYSHKFFDYSRKHGMFLPNSGSPGFIVVAGQPGFTKSGAGGWVGSFDVMSTFSYIGITKDKTNYVWTECQRCGKLGIEFEGRSNLICDCYSRVRARRNTHSKNLMEAYLAARQERFEGKRKRRRKKVSNRFWRGRNG